MNILAISDYHDCQNNIVKYLRELGHHVAEYDNGYDALNSLYNGEFDMVFADTKMPGISGIELLHIIKTFPSDKRVKVILLIEHGDFENAFQAFKAGAYDCILKPINITELVEILETVTKKQELEKIEEKLIKVMAFYDNSLIGESIKAILQNSDYMKFIGQACSMRECLGMIEKKNLILLLLIWIQQMGIFRRY